MNKQKRKQSQKDRISISQEKKQLRILSTGNLNNSKKEAKIQSSNVINTQQNTSFQVQRSKMIVTVNFNQTQLRYLIFVVLEQKVQQPKNKMTRNEEKERKIYETLKFWNQIQFPFNVCVCPCFSLTQNTHAHTHTFP